MGNCFEVANLGGNQPGKPSIITAMQTKNGHAKRRGSKGLGVAITGLAAALAVSLENVVQDSQAHAANNDATPPNSGLPNSILDDRTTGSLPVSALEEDITSLKGEPLAVFKDVAAHEAEAAEHGIAKLFASLTPEGAANGGPMETNPAETSGTGNDNADSQAFGAGLGPTPVESLGVSHPGQPIGPIAGPLAGMELNSTSFGNPAPSPASSILLSPCAPKDDTTPPAEQELPLFLQGTSLADELNGGSLDDALYGNEGDDLLAGGAGADLIDGGEGLDFADYSGSSQGVMINLESGENHGGDAQSDTLIDIEGVTGSNFDDDLTGKNGQANHLYGMDGDDVLKGGDDKDFLSGGSGADLLDGGAGNDDVAKYVSSAEGVHVSLLDGKGYTGDAVGDTLTNIEFLHGSLHDDWLIGDHETNRIEGRHGDDHIQGLGGNDRLLGGSGADILDGGDGEDIADYDWSDHGVVVDLTTGVGVGGEADGDVLISIEHLAGSMNDDILSGDDQNNRLWGRNGDDVLEGGGGNDRLDGGAGADTLIGGEGIDIADYSGATAGISLDLATGGLSGDAEGDTYDSIENVYGSNYNDGIAGDSGNNRLIGNAGNDVLFGAGGNDYLLGGSGNDILIGGTGADVFLFEGEFGSDTITDFWAGEGRTDRLWLRDQGFDSWDQVQAAMEQNGIDVLIQTDNGTITLQYTELEDLVQDDFIF